MEISATKLTYLNNFDCCIHDILYRRNSWHLKLPATVSWLYFEGSFRNLMENEWRPWKCTAPHVAYQVSRVNDYSLGDGGVIMCLISFSPFILFCQSVLNGTYNVVSILSLCVRVSRKVWRWGWPGSSTPSAPECTWMTVVSSATSSCRLFRENRSLCVCIRIGLYSPQWGICCAHRTQNNP